MIPGEALKYLDGFLLTIPKNHEDLFDPPSFSDNTDDAVFVKRRGTTSPVFPDLTFEDGTPFGGQEFPILYSAK
jgi:hypothetical protein